MVIPSFLTVIPLPVPGTLDGRTMSQMCDFRASGVGMGISIRLGPAPESCSVKCAYFDGAPAGLPTMYLYRPHVQASFFSERERVARSGVCPSHCGDLGCPATL